MEERHVECLYGIHDDVFVTGESAWDMLSNSSSS